MVALALSSASDTAPYRQGNPFRAPHAEVCGRFSCTHRCRQRCLIALLILVDAMQNTPSGLDLLGLIQQPGWSWILGCMAVESNTTPAMHCLWGAGKAVRCNALSVQCMMHYITCEEGCTTCIMPERNEGVHGFLPESSVQAASLCCPGLLAILFSELILNALQECKGYLPAIPEIEGALSGESHIARPA